MRVIEIAFVAYPVADLKRACRFYSETLGLKESHRWGDENEGWAEYDIGPGTLAITNMTTEWKPSSNGGVAALEVDDFNAAITGLKQAGVKFKCDTQESPVCQMAIIADPDGNSIFIHKRKS